jgi:threonine dehydrogenase-like Zn-dependent dehydrogenase
MASTQTADLPTTMTVPRFAGGDVISFADKPVPRPGPGQVLVAVKANALCASEMWAYHHGSTPTPGHEAAGVVAAAGAGTTLAVGTPGVIFLMDFCGHCRSCRLGLTNQCLAKRADYGFTHDGGYGPYELVNENVFFPVDSDVSLTAATMLLDIMGTGGHSLARARRVHPEPQSLLVTGAGPIGLGVLAMAKIIMGPGFPVLISDVNRYRLDLAARLGGLAINVAECAVADGLRGHGYGEVDLAIDASGKTTARRRAMDVLAKRGVLVFAGHGEDLTLNISKDMIAPERAVLGSEYFCFSELAGNLELFRKHRAYLAPIITHRFPVARIAEAFTLFLSGQTGKVVVEQ